MAAEPQPEKLYRVAIAYFSLTGNTAYVAKKMASAIETTAASSVPPIRVEVKLVDITGPEVTEDLVAVYSAADIVGVGGLAFAYHEPTPLRNRLLALPDNCLAGKKAFVFGTAGGNEGKMLSSMAGILSKKGAVVIGSIVIFAPGNFTVWGPAAGNHEEWGTKEINRVDKFIQDIFPFMTGKAQPRSVSGTVMGFFLGWVSDSMVQSMVGNMVVDKGKCIKCGLCMRQCPFGALTQLEDGFPQWNKAKCAGCCRCVNFCPKSCINSSSTTTKAHYKFSEDVIKEGDFSTRTVPDR